MMNQPLGSTAAQPDRGNPLRKVREGMKVYDSDDKEIGTVERVYLGEVSPRADERGEGPATARYPNQSENDLVQDLAKAFDNDQVPDELRARLQRMGFIRLDAKGLFAADRYILPDQIARVSGDKVILNTTKDRLIKRS